jgi:hypothetical protein
MTTPNPAPTPDRDLASPVDRALASAMRDAGWSWGVVPGDVAEQHLAAITALATEHAHVAARPPSPTWRSRMRRVAGLTIVKVAVGAGVAAAATTGGLAAGGHLPAPVQDAVADGVGWIGIDLPRPDVRPAPDSAADPDEVVEDAPRSTTTDEVPAGDTPDDGEVAEVVPDDAPPVTTPSPMGPPDDVPPAGPDDQDPAQQPPADGPPAGTDPGADRSGQQPGPPAEGEPGTRDTQGGANPGEADEQDRRPSTTAPRDEGDGQTQSGQVPTSSRR